MRKIILLVAAMSIAVIGCGQKTIDNLFKKYSGDEGYTSVTINGDLLRFARIFEADDCHEHDQNKSEISQVRILTQDKENKTQQNFYDMVRNEIRGKDYEEFMKVKEKDQDLVMMVRAQGKNFREFLMVAGGEDNVIIQIKGNLTTKDAKRFSANFRHDHNMDLKCNGN